MALEGGNAVKRTGLAGVIADARKKVYPGTYEARKDKSLDKEAEALAKYINDNIGGGGGAVDSVFGRDGEVVAEEGDYTTDQVTEGDNKYYPGEDAEKLAGIEDGADVTDAENVSEAGAQMTDEKSQPDGYASLDEDGKVPESELPDSVNATIQVVYNRSRADATKIDVDGDEETPDPTGFRFESTAAGDRGMKHITPAAYLTAARLMRLAQFGANRHYLVENVLYTILDTVIYRFDFPSMRLLDSHDIEGALDISDISANSDYIFCLVGDNCLVLNVSDYSTFANFSVLSTGSKRCVADDDYVYVQDYSDTSFIVFTPSGTVVSSLTYGGSGIFNCLAVDSGYVYVSQPGATIRKFSKTSPHTEVASVSVSYYPICLCAYETKVYVVDADFDVHILDSSLVEQLVFHTYAPAGVYIYDISVSSDGLVLSTSNTTGFYSQPGLSSLIDADYEWIDFRAASWSEAGMTGRVGPINIENNANSIAEIVASKGAADGFASLDSGGKVPSSQLPSGTVNSVFGRAGTVVAESGDYTTDQVTEGTNKYYPSTDSSKLAGIESGADVTDATNVATAGAQMTTEKSQANGYASLDGSGKVPTGELPDVLVGSVNYQGTWNASTNTPALASGVGTKGFYYVVSVPGSTDLDGITDWKSNDWAIFNGTSWEKIDNTDSVSSVFGRTGAVVAGSGDYTADQITETATRVFVSPTQESKLDGIEAGAEVNTVDSVFGRIGAVVAGSGDYTTDQVTEGTNKYYPSADSSKLAGIEAGAEVNNISDTNAAALTGGGETTLHSHPGGGGAVDSVFGRDGVVVATTGDYTAAQVTNAFDKTIDGTDDILNDSPVSGSTATDALTTLAASQWVESETAVGASWVVVDEFTVTEDGGMLWVATVSKGGNTRQSVLQCSWDYDGDTISDLLELASNDTGDTSEVTFAVNLASGTVTLLADAASTGWTVKIRKLSLMDGSSPVSRTVLNVDPTVLQRVDTGEFETAQDGVAYFSPKQHGGYFGKIERVYYSNPSHNDVLATGASKLIAGEIRGRNVVNGVDSRFATSVFSEFDGIDTYVGLAVGDPNGDLVLKTTATSVYSVWVDYVKTTPPTLSPTGQPFADPSSPLLKRADNGRWELPAITKHGNITSISDAGGGQITVSSTNTLSAGEQINITGTTNYNGLYVVQSATGANFTVLATYVATETGKWIDTNEYLSRETVFQFLGGTLFVRRIEDSNMDTNSTYMQIPDATTLAVLKFDGYFIQSGDTDDRIGINAVVGTSSLQIQIFGKLDMIETYAASAITIVRGLLTYMKDATS